MKKIETEDQPTTNQVCTGGGRSGHEPIREAIIHFLSVRADTGADSWYPRLKEARSAFRELSRGDLEIMSSVYRGDDQRHQVLHLACGQFFWISMEELKTLAPESVCPHCYGTDDLSMFGTIENLQQSVIRGSQHGAYFYSLNPLGTAEQEYQFNCLRHHHSYLATFAEYQRTKPRSNGCPLCGKTARRSPD